MIPEGVIEALEVVRKSARTNMLNKRAVIELARAFGFGEASDWLLHASDVAYMDALNEMGRRSG